ncbi:MAG TPA: HAMP domain-containing sensor histidine kinase [Gaiellaceae bacterium]|jgi:signal transduction histidine kinase|nr:HAMP domain-containing sensor histidine kinase [Gaiellaceae bacterium]
MLGSLRFRLPAMFLLGIALAVLVAALISVRFFQNYTQARGVDELRAESAGIVQLYAQQAGRETVPVSSLVNALGGDQLFWLPAYKGVTLLQGITDLPEGATSIDVRKLKGTATINVTIAHKKYLAVVRPLRLGQNNLFGALVVAKPTSQLRSRTILLIERLTLAFVGAVIVAGLFGLYLSRRIAEPLRKLSRAADEVAAGHYGVEVPEPRGRDEISHLSVRFSDMAAKLAESEQLSRNFLMSVSHELRTPLTAIRGHVSALQEGVIDDPDMREASLEVIGEEAMRLERLVGDVLDLAKLDAHRFTVLQEEVDMQQLSERAYAAFGEEARRRGIDYRLDVRASPVILTDGDRVLQIIVNLLSNAFRWTPEGGRIELGLTSENGSVEVAVADTGPGITPEERERIFRPFWSRDGGGTGLGLAIARELALALGGQISLDTEPGRGSRFVLLLPTT